MNPPIRILVVDDNRINLKLVLEVLRSARYAVTGVVDAEAALQVLEEFPLPDVLLVDIALPGMDGLTLTRLLRSREQTRDIHIIAFTASAMKGDAEKARAAGCDAYFTKPLSIRALARDIEASLVAAKNDPRTNIFCHERSASRR